MEYRNEVQVLTAAKDGLVDQNKSLTAQKNELVEKNKKLRQKETELKNSVAQLNDEVTNWKAGFYREKDHREQLEADIYVLNMELERELQLHFDGETDLVNCMQTIRSLNDDLELLRRSMKELTEAAEPVANLFEPRKPGVEVRPLVDRLKDTPGRLKAYLQRLRKSIPQQVLSFLKSFYPAADVSVIAGGVAGDCSDEKLKELMREVESVAEKVASHINLK